jgi:hypothetical protein
MLILTIIFSALGILTGAFGVAGMGTSRRQLQSWSLPLIVASLVFAFIEGGWPTLGMFALIDLVLFTILTKSINSRHHGMDFDRGLHQAQNMDVDQMLARIAEKHRKAKK